MHTIHANGARIPALGFGTFELDDATTRRMVASALDMGYRHVDTAQIYKNEAAVGQGIKDSTVARESLFLTSKVWMNRFAKGDLEASVEESLRRLATDHVDLMLLHWPNREIPLAQTIEALETVKARGLATHIGVSNFPVAWLSEATRLSDTPLVANQVEYHPFLDQRPVLRACREHDMALTAYSPIAQGKVFGNDTLKRIGAAHGKNEGQVTLRWLMQQSDVVAIPRTSKPAHAESNLDIFDFRLSDDEMAEISALRSDAGRIIDPSWAPDWDKAA